MNLSIDAGDRREHYKDSSRKPSIGDVTDNGVVTEITEDGRLILDSRRQGCFRPDALVFLGKFEDDELLSIEDWFNPRNKGHLRAYKKMLNEGEWLAEFIPRSVKFSQGWRVLLADSLADCWIEYLCPELAEDGGV